MVRSSASSPQHGSPGSIKETDVELASLVSNDGKERGNPFNRLVTKSRIASSSCQKIKMYGLLVTLVLAVLFIGASNFKGPTDPMLAVKKSSSGAKTLSIATWNIAAINNNPFEYWITYDENPEYSRIMKNIEDFIEEPGDKDVIVSEVFSESMFSELEKRMKEAGWGDVRSYWESDYKNRKIVSGFMKDGELGSKRLASMPDRVTNTINVSGSDQPVCRPTVINMYGEDLSTLPNWWKKWEKFMFDDALTIKTPDGDVTKKPFEMLKEIKKSKYPAITEDEEALSLPLQTMCGAIFDAILVHMMNTVSKPNVWQDLKRTMVESLNKKKVPHTLELLDSVYGNSDIITLQEVSSALVDQALKGPLGKKFYISTPADMDPERDQNSIIMLNKKTFQEEYKEITPLVEAAFPEGVKVPVSKGDINAVRAVDNDGTPYVIASFHGDTNGLATIPVNTALVKALEDNSELSNHKLIFGLDANTYENAIPEKQQDVMKWGESYSELGLTSCWGDIPQKSNYTTFNARTYLQPQLNKACKSSEKREKGDVNPKDFIVFRKTDFDVMKTWKDNTGNREFTENMAFPTLNFPSDHAVLATILNRKY